MSTYFSDLRDAIISSLKGMSVTIKHLFSKPVTVQYPDERLPVPKSYLGRHKLEQSGCKSCNVCIKACPVDCLQIESERHGKVIEWKSFTVNYGTCMFCGLCVDACPSGGLIMTQDFDLSEYDRQNCLVELLTWTGLRPEDIEAIEKAKKEKEEKARKKAAEKEKAEKAEGQAAEAVEAKEDKEEEKKEEPPSADE